MGKTRHRTGQADGHGLPHDHRANYRHGSAGDGGQRKALRRRRGRQIAAVLPHLPTEGRHREGLAAVRIVGDGQGAGSEGAFLVVGDVGVRPTGVHRRAIDGNGGHFYSVGIELMSRCNAARPADGGFIAGNILTGQLPFHPEIGVIYCGCFYDSARCHVITVLPI